jgi:hypothetical protein
MDLSTTVMLIFYKEKIVGEGNNYVKFMKRFIVVLIRDLWEDCGPQAGR